MSITQVTSLTQDKYLYKLPSKKALLTFAQTEQHQDYDQDITSIVFLGDQPR